MKKWASELLAGCDGGDLENAKVWMCGIEWGWAKEAKLNSDQDEAKRLEYYTDGVLKEIASGKDELQKFYDFKKVNEFRFNKQFAKLYTVVKGLKIENYLKEMEHFSPSDVFKMNLFPIEFKRDCESLWKKYKLAETFPEFPTKSHYQNWCRENRFPYFAELVKKKNPKVVICTGLGYHKDFLKAFSGGNIAEFNESGKIQDPSKKNNVIRSYHYAQLENGTHLFVVPFLVSRYGLNSGELLKQMGKVILEKLDLVKQSQAA